MNQKKLSLCALAVFLLSSAAFAANSTSATSTSARATVTIMTAQKTFTAEGLAAVPKIVDRPKIQNFSGEVHTVVENLDTKPQTVNVRFQELDNPAYDLYVNKTLVKTIKREDLESGIPLQLPAGYGSGYLPLFQKIKDSVPMVGRSTDTTDSGGGVVLADMVSSCNAAVVDFERSRSASLVLVPDGRAMSRNPLYNILTREEAENHLNSRLKDLGVKRSVIYTIVKDQNLRDRALAALTPLQLTAVVVSKPNAKGLRQLQCSLANQSEIPLNARIEIVCPPGWAKAQPLALKDVKPGGSGKVVFQIKGPAGATATGLRIKATVRAGKVSFQTDATVTS